MAKKGKQKIESIDLQFAFEGIVPSTQQAYKRIDSSVDLAVKHKEKKGITVFRRTIHDTITASIKNKTKFPSEKDLFVFIAQFLHSNKDYESRDIDNIAKTVLDSFSGRLYKNDRQVSTLLVTKQISNKVKQNFAYFAIKELNNNNNCRVTKVAGLERAFALYQETIKRYK